MPGGKRLVYCSRYIRTQATSSGFPQYETRTGGLQSMLLLGMGQGSPFFWAR